jgi:phosphopentomutase
VTTPAFSRAIVLVLDSVGIGELPDAHLYGDEGSHTLGNICRDVAMRLPTLKSLGLGCIATLRGIPPADNPEAAFGRMAERSAGKDSVTGHWEMMGIVLDRPFPTYPHGFPRDLIDRFEARIGRATIGNVVASGTQVIDALGPAHLRTGAPIVYTSADSVFQIAAHEDVIRVPELYRICGLAYELAVEEQGMGRVIARPFVGSPGSFRRTANRHDYAMPPRGDTLLDRLAAASLPVVAIGKISDLFAGRGVTRSVHTSNDAEVMDAVLASADTVSGGLIFANLVDFDAQYGHRNDVAGYAANLERFDACLAELLPALSPGDLLVITADHGNDPTTPSTDHSREHVPLLVYGHGVRAGAALGTRATFADLGQTLAEVFSVPALAAGASFLGELSRS